MLPKAPAGRWRWAIRKVMLTIRRKNLKIGLGRNRVEKTQTVAHRLENLENELFFLRNSFEKSLKQAIEEVNTNCSKAILGVQDEQNKQWIEFGDRMKLLGENVQSVAASIHGVQTEQTNQANEIASLQSQLDTVKAMKDTPIEAPTVTELEVEENPVISHKEKDTIQETLTQMQSQLNGFLAYQQQQLTQSAKLYDHSLDTLQKQMEDVLGKDDNTENANNQMPLFATLLEDTGIQIQILQQTAASLSNLIVSSSTSSHSSKQEHKDKIEQNKIGSDLVKLLVTKHTHLKEMLVEVKTKLANNKQQLIENNHNKAPVQIILPLQEPSQTTNNINNNITNNNHNNNDISSQQLHDQLFQELQTQLLASLSPMMMTANNSNNPQQNTTLQQESSSSKNPIPYSSLALASKVEDLAEDMGKFSQDLSTVTNQVNYCLNELENMKESANLPPVMDDTLADDDSPPPSIVATNSFQHSKPVSSHNLVATSSETAELRETVELLKVQLEDMKRMMLTSAGTQKPTTALPLEMISRPPSTVNSAREQMLTKPPLSAKPLDIPLAVPKTLSRVNSATKRGAAVVHHPHNASHNPHYFLSESPPSTAGQSQHGGPEDLKHAMERFLLEMLPRYLQEMIPSFASHHHPPGTGNTAELPPRSAKPVDLARSTSNSVPSSRPTTGFGGLEAKRGQYPPIEVPYIARTPQTEDNAHLEDEVKPTTASQKKRNKALKGSFADYDIKQSDPNNNTITFMDVSPPVMAYDPSPLLSDIATLRSEHLMLQRRLEITSEEKLNKDQVNQMIADMILEQRRKDLKKELKRDPLVDELNQHLQSLTQEMLTMKRNQDTFAIELRKEFDHSITKALDTMTEEIAAKKEESVLSTKGLCLGCGRLSNVKVQPTSHSASPVFFPALTGNISPGPDIYRGGFKMPVHNNTPSNNSTDIPLIMRSKVMTSSEMSMNLLHPHLELSNTKDALMSPSISSLPTNQPSFNLGDELAMNSITEFPSTTKSGKLFRLFIFFLFF